MKKLIILLCAVVLLALGCPSPGANTGNDPGLRSATDAEKDQIENMFPSELPESGGPGLVTDEDLEELNSID